MSNCIIKLDKDGLVEVLTPSGDPSVLYSDILKLVGDQNKALEIVSVAYTDTFNELYPDKELEPTVEEAFAVYNFIKSKEVSISNEDLTDISDIIFETQIKSINTLEETLTNTFRPKGILDINENRLRESKLYSEKEILDILNNNFDIGRLNRTINVVSKLAQLDFSVTNLELNTFYNVLSSDKDSLGRHKKLIDSEVDNMIVEATKGYSSEVDFLNRIKTLDIPSLLQQINSDEKLSKDIYNRISSFTPVSVVEIIDNKLVNKPTNSTISTINSTLLVGQDSSKFRTVVDTLKGVDLDILESEPGALKESLNDLEKLAADINVDIIGLKNLSASKAMQLLDITSDLVNKASQKRVSTEDIATFSEMRDKMLGNDVGFEEDLEIIDPIYKNLNLLKLYSELPNEKLFSIHGLLKVGDNLYHRVSNNETITELYEELYKRYLNDSNFIPNGYITIKDKFNPKFKPTILEGIKSFVNTRSTGLDIDSPVLNERASIYQVLFNHKPLDVSTTNAFSAIAGATNSSNYLVGKFTSDFYNSYLKEKQINSKIYKNVLSKFAFNNKDITVKNIDNRFLNTLDTLKQFFPEYTQIREYAALKKNDPINELAIVTSPIGILPNVERIRLANNLQVLPNYQGSTVKLKNYIHTVSKDSFIKVDNNLYQIVGNNVFAKVTIEKSNNYFTIPVLNYNRAEVMAIENTHNIPITNPSKSYSELSNTINNKTLSASISKFLEKTGAIPHSTKVNTFIVNDIEFSVDGENVNITKISDSKLINDLLNIASDSNIKNITSDSSEILKIVNSSQENTMVSRLEANPDPQVEEAFRITEGTSYLSFKYVEDKVELAMLSTSEEDRGKGQAKKLLTEFTKALDQTNSKSILYADPRDTETDVNKLVKLYESFGYRPSPAFNTEFGLYEMERNPKIIKVQNEITAVSTSKVKEVEKVKEVFSVLQNPIDIVSLSNEIYVNECRG